MENFFDQETLGKIIKSLVILLAGLTVFFGLKRVFEYLADLANLPRLSFRPLHLLIRYSVLAVALFLVLSTWGYQMNGLLGFVGTVFGLVAIGFVAVWSVLSNVLCTFVLILFKPFSVGDELEFPSDLVSGKVVDLTLIFTTLRTPDGAYYQIPNNMFFQKMFKRRAGATHIDLQEQLRQEKPVD